MIENCDHCRLPFVWLIRVPLDEDESAEIRLCQFHYNGMLDKLSSEDLLRLMEDLVVPSVEQH